MPSRSLGKGTGVKRKLLIPRHHGVLATNRKVEAFYYAFGEDDAVIIVDLPSNVKATALALTTSGSGAVRIRTTPLLTVEEVDQALEIKTQYRAPGE
jgi:hypothetical protein